METTKKENKRSNTFRVWLARETHERALGWARQVEAERKGAKIKLTDIIHFILEAHSDQLSNAEIKTFQERYISEVDVARWALRQISAAQSRGEKISLIDLIGSNFKSTQKQKTQKNTDKRSASDSVTATDFATDTQPIHLN